MGQYQDQKKSKKERAAKMLKEGLSASIIRQRTGLHQTTIDRIKKELREAEGK